MCFGCNKNKSVNKSVNKPIISNNKKYPVLQVLMGERKRLNLLDNGRIHPAYEYKCNTCDKILITGRLCEGNYDTCYTCFKNWPKEDRRNMYDNDDFIDD